MKPNTNQMKTLDALIQRSGGFNEVIKHFGWQGGTIHQVYEETMRRLKASGYIFGLDGVIYQKKLVVSQKDHKIISE